VRKAIAVSQTSVVLVCSGELRRSHHIRSSHQWTRHAHSTQPAYKSDVQPVYRCVLGWRRYDDQQRVHLLPHYYYR